MAIFHTGGSGGARGVGSGKSDPVPTRYQAGAGRPRRSPEFLEQFQSEIALVAGVCLRSHQPRASAVGGYAVLRMTTAELSAGDRPEGWPAGPWPQAREARRTDIESRASVLKTLRMCILKVEMLLVNGWGSCLIFQIRHTEPVEVWGGAAPRASEKPHFSQSDARDDNL